MRIMLAAPGLILLLPFAIPVLAQVGHPDPAVLFAQADSNHDGVVSRQEFLAARAARFDKLDRNHDGVIDKAEMQQAAERLRTLAVGMGAL